MCFLPKQRTPWPSSRWVRSAPTKSSTSAGDRIFGKPSEVKGAAPLPRGLSSGSARIRARRWPRSATRLNRVLHPFDHPCNEEGDPRPLSGFNAQSPVEGSMTVDTRVTVFAGNPPQRACSRMMSSSGATYTQ